MYTIQIQIKKDFEAKTAEAIEAEIKSKIKNHDFSDIKANLNDFGSSEPYDSKMSKMLKSLEDVERFTYGTIGYPYGLGGSYGDGFKVYIKSESIPLVRIEDDTDYLNATINRDLFLSGIFGDIDEDMQRKFNAWIEENNEDDGMSGIEAFSKAMGWNVTSDNTCNYENDLDGEIQWHVAYIGHDWVYSGLYIFIEKHLGGDVRGNYGSTEVYKIDVYDGLSSFLNPRVSWSFKTYTDATGKEHEDDLYEFSEQYEQGYSSSPTYQLEKDLESFKRISIDTVDVVLKDGARGRMYVSI